MGEEAWKLSIEAQDCHQALPGAPAGSPLVCQLPSSPSLKMAPQTRSAVTW